MRGTRPLSSSLIVSTACSTCASLSFTSMLFSTLAAKSSGPVVHIANSYDTRQFHKPLVMVFSKQQQLSSSQQCRSSDTCSNSSSIVVAIHLTLFRDANATSHCMSIVYQDEAYTNYSSFHSSSTDRYPDFSTGDCTNAFASGLVVRTGYTYHQ
jgi:hypothetical protein